MGWSQVELCTEALFYDSTFAESRVTCVDVPIGDLTPVPAPVGAYRLTAAAEPL